LRRGRIDAAFRDASMSDLALLDIVADPETDVHAWAATLQLSERFRLTTYDAAYLELARRRDLPLASLDRELQTAARALGTPLLGA
jgi:predicted nucleic acid-binding protein